MLKAYSMFEYVFLAVTMNTFRFDIVYLDIDFL